HDDDINKVARVQELIHAYRVRGHLMADTDPLEYRQRKHPDLDVTRHGLTLWDLDREFPTGGFGGTPFAKLPHILGVLRDSACRTAAGSTCSPTSSARATARSSASSRATSTPAARTAPVTSSTTSAPRAPSPPTTAAPPASRSCRTRPTWRRWTLSSRASSGP